MATETSGYPCHNPAATSWRALLNSTQLNSNLLDMAARKLNIKITVMKTKSVLRFVPDLCNRDFVSALSLLSVLSKVAYNIMSDLLMPFLGKLVEWPRNRLYSNW